MAKSRKKRKLTGKKLTAAQLQKEVFRVFYSNPKKRFSAKQLIKAMRISNNRDAVEHALQQLLEKDKIVPINDYKYKLNKAGLPKDQQVNETEESTGEKPRYQPKKLYEGRVDMTRSGSAYIVVDGMEQDVHVSARRLRGALNGDRVQITIRYARGRYKPEGEVFKVLDRATEFFMGTLRMFKNYGIVLPDKRGMEDEIVIPIENLNEAQDGDKVIVKVTDWPTRPHHSIRGRVTTVVGASGTSDMEMKSILINNGFNIQFPEEVIEESNALQEDFSPEAIEGRRDMREVLTFTIDPDNAKDFDDAISYEELEDGNIEIGVHIADVTHYVRPGTALDREAYSRSTSVYLVDRVCPMLPEKISNELCSLRPNEDKMTFSTVFTFDRKGKVLDYWIGRTVTHSNRRFTYGEAQQVLDTKEGDYSKELLMINRIALKLRKDRFKNGSLNFESPEVKFKLDEDGTPIGIYLKERRDANMLIEDFMLLANKTVATHIIQKGKTEGRTIPFVYRIHDMPDQDKLADFALFAKELGFQLRYDTPAQLAKSFNRLAEAAETDETLKMLQPLAIRTMAKAAYSPDNIGHYGLAFENYSHFTSPIRRYADVLAHRILVKNLDDTYRYKLDKLEQQCKHISAQERKAIDAERESIKYKQVEYMQDHKGETFDGVIVGFSERGIFVQLQQNFCEGMVGYDTMEEAFDLSSGRLKITGRTTGNVYQMGQLLRVKVVNTNLSKRQIDLELVE